ncbi:MAG: glutaredoxin domain-containing protein [Actinomycetota bacterium]
MTDKDLNGSTNIDAVEFYWRPGCPFCAMLERDLNGAGIPLAKRNIWDDPNAAAYVRSVADGNETVPTIQVAGRAMVNPPIDDVRALLNDVAPHLVKD